MPDETVPRVAEVWAFGELITFTYAGSLSSGGGHETLEPTIGEGGEDTPEAPCEVVSGMSDADKLGHLIKFALAQAVKAAEGLPNQNAEAATAVYINNGELFTTPFVPTSPQQFMGEINWGAVPAGAQIVAFMHTHPAYLPDQVPPYNLVQYTNPADPGYLLRPSDTRMLNGRLLGDWIAFNDASVRSNNPNLVMVIAGAVPGVVGLQIRSYTASDYPYSTSSSTSDMGLHPINRDLLPPCAP